MKRRKEMSRKRQESIMPGKRCRRIWICPNVHTLKNKRNMNWIKKITLRCRYLCPLPLLVVITLYCSYKFNVGSSISDKVKTISIAISIKSNVCNAVVCVGNSLMRIRKDISLSVRPTAPTAEARPRTHLRHTEDLQFQAITGYHNQYNQAVSIADG